jgi:NADH dehydrogenase FAD-containing subunit
MPPLLIYRQRELVAANMKLRRQRNAAVLLDEVTGVDTAARRIETRLAQAGSTIFWSSHTGSQYAYFGQGDWPKLAPGLKSIDDATLIRRRVLLAFEEARSSFLTFPVVRVTDGDISRHQPRQSVDAWRLTCGARHGCRTDHR